MKNKYYDDFRCCELKTNVKEVIEEKGFFWHSFDNTIFYVDEHHPDHGFINQCEVLKGKLSWSLIREEDIFMPRMKHCHC